MCLHASEDGIGGGVGGVAAPENRGDVIEIFLACEGFVGCKGECGAGVGDYAGDELVLWVGIGVVVYGTAPS